MKIAVIGGGASGIMAAITAANCGAEVTILEKKERIGKKILATGNGKCNFTNKDITDDDYRSQYKGIYKNYISQFSEKDTISLFLKWGMLVKERDGYCYPRSDQASTVLSILEQQCKIKNLTILTETIPESIIPKKQGFQISLNTKKKLYFDKVIVATGSFAGERNRDSLSGYTYAKELGHTIIPIVPSLVQVKAKGKEFKKVAGVRCHAAITLYIKGEKPLTESGELQLTDYGISGIPVFQLSRYVGYAAYYKKDRKATIDFLPEFAEKQWEEILNTRWNNINRDLALEQFFTGFLNYKISYMLITSLEYEAAKALKNYTLDDILKIGRLMKKWTIIPEETNPFENAQVCAGGVSMDQVTCQLESKLIPGLYFCGEILDVDGRCGGYNLQWAWSSGYIAGKSAAT
ncbi:MAG: aminoacetone oxidase family FAD-binding enzyme [Lachnospiraceae bacterium]|nr:aminoacetone oxidase family FAD-binding enzyme [Lachnospiraceae bacterium]